MLDLDPVADACHANHHGIYPLRRPLNLITNGEANGAAAEVGGKESIPRRLLEKGTRPG